MYMTRKKVFHLIKTVYAVFKPAFYCRAITDHNSVR